ncbi:MAG TPA: GGDEF domain-containing protein [Acidimicrobiales bacterium]|nr:GGDEF domain-containing protein [Acidimicrobiales bacterium]
MPDAPRGSPGGPEQDHRAYLGLLSRTAAVCDGDCPLPEAAAAVLEDVCTVTGWLAGRLREVDGSRPGAVVAATGSQLGETAAETLCEQVVASGRPEWSTEASPDQHLSSAVAAPVMVRRRAVAVLELFAEPPALPGPVLADVLVAVASHLARVAERDEAEERLRTLAATTDEERRGLEQQMAERALRDPLTGLPNRAVFLDRLDLALARAGRLGLSVAVLACDLDRFRAVNESFGHSAGDRLLAAVAARLESSLRPGDTVARMGGDEFAVLGEDLGGAGEAAEITRRVQEAFSSPFPLDGGEVRVTASTGVAVAIGGGDGDLLLREASAARERARGRGRGRVEVFDDAMRAVAPWHQATEHELRDAIGLGQLRLVYQPIVALASGEVVGVEALVRWHHPSRGLLGPVDFIPLAEESGLIEDLGRWVLQEACVQATGWQSLGGADRPLLLSVNVSVQQFRDEGWAAEVAGVLAATGMPGSRLVLEITESTLMDDSEVSGMRLQELRDLGVRLAVDDFGTGYSSLAYLRRMPVDFLKIDKSFVDGVTGDAHESALARAVVKLAATLGLAAVAEGIERPEQAEILSTLGCRYGQGLWLGPPMPAGELEKRLREAEP